MKRFVLGLTVVMLMWVAQGCQKKEEATLPKGHPEVQNPHANIQNPHDGKLTYQVPKEWIQEEPQSRMRLSQYRLPGVNGKADAVMAEFHFPGTGGTVEANLQRWYGQFKQPDGSPTAHHAQRKEFEVNGMKVVVVYVTGTYLQSASGMMMGDVQEKPGYAMLAAIAETPAGPWFFKAVGPQETINHWRPAFEKFVQTFKMAE